MQYPEESGPAPAQYEDQPIAPEETQSQPDDEENEPLTVPEDCDPNHGGCAVHDGNGCFVYPDGTEGCYEMNDFVDGAAGDARQTSETLNGPTDAPVPAPPPDEAPETPTVTAPSRGLEQYPLETNPSQGTDPAPAPRPVVPQPAPGPGNSPNTGLEQIAPSAEPHAGTVPVQETQPVLQPPPKAEALVEESREVLPGSVPERAAAPVKDGPKGRARKEVERSKLESEGDQEAASRRGETDVGPRSAPEEGASLEEPEVAEQQELAAKEGGKSTVYTLGGSALLIAGVAVAGRFLKR